MPPVSRAIGRDGRTGGGGNLRQASRLWVLPILAGCSSYLGSAREVSPEELRSDPGWILAGDVPFVPQEGASDCGAAALAMVLRYWGRDVDAEVVSGACGNPVPGGTSAGDLRDFARSRGLKAYVIAADLTDLRREIERRRPVVVGMVKPTREGDRTHFEVVVGIHPEVRRIATLDPARGLTWNGFQGFLEEWEPSKRLALVAFESGATEDPVRDGP